MKRALRRRKKIEHRKTAQQLAPPEEQQAHKSAQAAPGAGPKIAPDLMEGSNQVDLFRMDPIVIAILLAAAGFILFIAWEVSRMPAPPGD